MCSGAKRSAAIRTAPEPWTTWKTKTRITTNSTSRSTKLGALEPIAALNRIKILETDEPLVDIRDFCPEVQVHEHACPYLRRTVAEMLNRAQASLPPGHRFRVGTALRTLSMQKGGWDSYFGKMKEAHPEWPLSALRRATNRYFAPYDQPAPPGHCTGGAVDVALIGPDGEPLDVTSPTQGWEAAYTWSDRISPEAKSNRMVMVEAMLGAGFSNCREEFWHYSWGDSAWAVRIGVKTCPYGWAHAPAVVETRFSGGLAEDLQQIDELAWVCRAGTREDGTPGLCVGALWAEGKAITLRVAWPDALPDTVYMRTGSEGEWQPLDFEREGRAAIIRSMPEAPRVYITERATG